MSGPGQLEKACEGAGHQTENQAEVHERLSERAMAALTLTTHPKKQYKKHWH